MADRGVEIWKLFFQAIQTIGIIGGAIWAAWRFKRERTHAPQIEFTVDANFHGPSEGAYTAEYVLTFNNKGRTRVQVLVRLFQELTFVIARSHCHSLIDYHNS
jgi:hypothetical protein